MAKQPAGKKPVTRSSPAPKPVATKKVAGKAAPVAKPAIKAVTKPVAKAPVKRVAVPAKSNSKTAAKEKAPAAKKLPAKKVATKAPVSKAKPRSASKASSADVPQIELTAKQQRFIDEYLVDLNGTQAAIRAGYSPDTAKQMASENLSKPYLQLAIAEARKQQQARTHINADALLLQAWMIATADSRELTEVHVGCCRHCWGEGFKYQRTVAEFNKERERFDIDQRMGMRDIVMDAPTLTEAWQLLDDELEHRAKQYPDTRDRLATQMQQLSTTLSKAQELMDHGYMPLQRFGKYTLDVLDQNGERLYYGMFESKADSHKMLEAMRREFPGAKFTQGTMNEHKHKLMAGIRGHFVHL